MKYLTVFLAVALLQLMLFDEAMAQRRIRVGSGRAGTRTPALTNFEYSTSVGYKKFWDQQSQGFSIYFDGKAVYYLGKNFGLGAFSYVAGGGGQYNDGTFNEPSVSWQGGLEGKMRQKNYSASLLLGYGQNSRHTQIASGLTDVVFSDYLKFGLEYRIFGRRLGGQAWLPEAGVALAGKKALKNQTPDWQGYYSISNDFIPEIAKIAGDFTVVAIKMGKVTVDWGLGGSANMYDFKNNKVFYEAITWLKPSYDNNDVAKLYCAYQSGITGINMYRMILGVSVDASFLLKSNQVNSTQQTNRRRIR